MTLKSLVLHSYRSVEDYSIIIFGPAFFKVLRLLIIAMMGVHYGACIFFRVKLETAQNEHDVIEFYSSRQVGPEVIFSRFFLTA